jgi:hypothetical protein
MTAVGRKVDTRHSRLRAKSNDERNPISKVEVIANIAAKASILRIVCSSVTENCGACPTARGDDFEHGAAFQFRILVLPLSGTTAHTR